MKLLFVICAFVACASAASTVLKITSHLDVEKVFVSSSDDNPLDFLDSNEIEQLTSMDQHNELSKKHPVSLCHLCHQVVGFVIHHTHNHTSKQSVARTLKYVCHHVHRQRETCKSFVGNYSMSITNMIVANRTSYEICNKLGSCKHHAGDEIEQVLNTPQQTHLVLNNEESSEDDEEYQDANPNENDDNSQINTGEVEPDYDFHENRVGNDDSQINTGEVEPDYDFHENRVGNDDSQINTGEVEPDYDFHENRVGNDDSHDNDNIDQFLVSMVKLTNDELDNSLQSEEDAINEKSQKYLIEGQLCKVCKVVVTSVLTKTTAKSSKLDIKEVLDSACRHVIPILQEKCKNLLKGFESKIVLGIWKKHSSKDICTIDLKNMCSISHYDDVDINKKLEFDDIFPHDTFINEINSTW